MIKHPIQCELSNHLSHPGSTYKTKIYLHVTFLCFSDNKREIERGERQREGMSMVRGNLSK